MGVNDYWLRGNCNGSIFGRLLHVLALFLVHAIAATLNTTSSYIFVLVVHRNEFRVPWGSMNGK